MLTEPKLDPRGTSPRSTRRCAAWCATGSSVYRIREEALRAARPDLIVTQEQCEVCAVSFAEVEQAARALLDDAGEIVSLKPNRLDDVLDDFDRVAAAAGVRRGAERSSGRRQPRAARAHPRAAVATRAAGRASPASSGSTR